MNDMQFKERNDMRRTMIDRFRALAVAAALALSVAPVAHAQRVMANAPARTEAQTAAIKRLNEVLEVLNTGDYAKMRSYFEANSIDIRTGVPGVVSGSWNEQVFSQVLLRYHLSRGLDFVRVTFGDAPPLQGDVVGIVRNRTTGDEEYLALRVEPQAPYRIIWNPIAPPAAIASWNLKPAASTAVTEQQRLEEIGSYLKRMGDAELFSGAIVIARDGKPVFAQAYGYADREKKIPNTLDTPFLMGSMSKLFTGLAVGQLAEQGKLSYDDPLAKFLPDFPDPESAKKIRIKHLLSHTAGLGNAATLWNPDLIDRQTTARGMVDVLERTALAFEPGTKWAYSNAGFVLLGRIIEIASGQDYYDYMQQRVFAPAGATTAAFPLLPKDGEAVVPMALPYEPAWDADSRMSIENRLGKEFRRGGSAGSGVVSANDLIKLANAMRDGRIVKPETFRLHTSPKPEIGATMYGYGFATGPYGRPFVGHNGRAQGQCTDFGELRDTPYTIVVLSNLHRNWCRPVTERILRVLRPS
jgi:CubicO group peptidase (beta-lactamase class C family)